jgi:hypothetical protein
MPKLGREPFKPLEHVELRSVQSPRALVTSGGVACIGFATATEQFVSLSSLSPSAAPPAPALLLPVHCSDDEMGWHCAATGEFFTDYTYVRYVSPTHTSSARVLLWFFPLTSRTLQIFELARCLQTRLWQLAFSSCALHPSPSASFCGAREGREFTKRALQCTERVWTCSITGKSGLNYREALQVSAAHSPRTPTHPHTAQQPFPAQFHKRALPPPSPSTRACLWANRERQRCRGRSKGLFVVCRDQWLAAQRRRAVVDVVDTANPPLPAHPPTYPSRLRLSSHLLS